MAFDAYIQIEGIKQGQFKGGGGKANPNRIPISSFSFSLQSPRDPLTGMASGKRQYQPIVIQKSWSQASVQMYQALATNETLKSVLIEFFTATPQGVETPEHSISLTNASITEVKELPENTQPSTGSELEEISFVFQKIEIKDKSGANFTDDWSAR